MIGEAPRRLEAMLHAPAGTVRAAAIVCHPHPQYGGDMDNPVVVGVIDALVSAGIAALRFNFAGVGASEGTYDGGAQEQCDVGAAESALTDRMPKDTPLAIVGYSFGARVGARAAAGLPRVRRVVAVGPPLAFMDWSFVGALRQPFDVVVGDRDQYCSLDSVQRLGVRTTIIAGADHFFARGEAAVGRAVADLLADL